MRSFLRVVLFLSTSTALLAQSSGFIFLVRHAEKQSDADDTPLSVRGTMRAECLARTLHDAGITPVSHSQFVSTVQTADPVLANPHLCYEADDTMNSRDNLKAEGTPEHA